MLATYSLKVDLGRASFWCDNAPAGSDNLIPSPLIWSGIATRGVFLTETVTKHALATDYGATIVRCVTGDDFTEGMYFGRDADNVVDDIPVAPSTEYTLSCWVRGVTNYTSVDVALNVGNQSPYSLGTSDELELTGDWQRLDLTFTTGASDTYIYARVAKDDDSTQITFDVTGFMLVTGATPASAFDAGDACDDYAALSDITAYVRRLEWRYGMDSAFGEVAPGAELIATLDNADGAFLLEDSGAAYYGLLTPGALVRLQATASSVTYTLWTGRLKSINVAPGAWQTMRTAELVARDMTWDLMDGEYKPVLQTDVTADEALTTLFNADLEAVRWPYEATPALVADITDFETGRTAQAWVGDNSENEAQRGIQPLQFIRDLLAPEGGGRFFWNATTGKWTFLNREHDILETSAHTFTGDEFIPDLSEYVYGDLLVNKVSFDYIPREVGTPGSVIYSYPNLPLSIGPRQEHRAEFVARYFDVNNVALRVAAFDQITPVAYTDYEAVDEILPTPHDDYTARVTMTVTYYADRADVLLEIADTGTTHLTTLQLRGTPLYTYDRQTITALDDSSIEAYGIHEQPPRLLVNVDNETFARALAEWTIARYAAPFGRFATVTLQANQDATNTAQVLGRQVGDKITINVTRLGHTREYVIAGMMHMVDPETGSHLCTWALTPLPLETYAQFDVTDTDDGSRMIL